MSERKPAQNMTADLISGGAYELTQDVGSVIVLSYFASWCAPCQTEAPQMDALYRQRLSSGTKFVGVDFKDPNKSGASAWIAYKHLSFPIVSDPNGKTNLQLGDIPLGPPSTVLIDKAGRVAAVYIGDLLPADLNPVLNELTAES